MFGTKSDLIALTLELCAFAFESKLFCLKLCHNSEAFLVGKVGIVFGGAVLRFYLFKLVTLFGKLFYAGIVECDERRRFVQEGLLPYREGICR